ncbi:MAG TPA: hypothetical protein VH257_08260, partial [Chloroflexota bacterium]|nr:hypothetical protein [Chloroflexota bacterium]
LSPERIRATIQFALKVAASPKTLAREDYDAMRGQGVSEEELVELILVASMASSGDTLADALKIDVDPSVSEALAAA